MDIHFQLNDDHFVWDSDKAFENERKHGISFYLAAEVFLDPFVSYEDAGTLGEARQAAIGFAQDWTMVFVVHLIREDELIRIISARPTTARERKDYEDNV